MALYQALYRKYRPRDFADVCGQEHIVSTLKTELSANRISHAYLFCGTRGTGKTTCAKIFAKAVNCLDLQNGDPCNRCENCRDIDSGANMDVVEIDAASNNGVDNIRDIRDEVVYSPAKGNKRVYIIDEVHMLSSGAFNALLKTLEEPPEHVLFILATTEAQKIPPTILSRCQRFDFRRISLEDITARVLEISLREQIAIDDDAARLIAHLADGALRDALSILDQCACTGAHITYEFVAQTAGVTDSSYAVELGRAIAKKDFASALVQFSALYQGNREPALVCQELLALFRDLLIIKSVAQPKHVLLTPLDRQSALPALAAAFTLEELLYALETLQDALDALGKSLNRRTEMESALLRLCYPQTNTTPAALLARIVALEKKLSAAMAGGFPASAAPLAPQAEPKDEPSVLPSLPPSAEEPAPPVPKAALPETEPPPAPAFWSNVIAETNSNAYKGVLKGFLEETSAYLDGDTLVICTDQFLKQTMLSKPEALQDIKILVNAATGHYYKIKISQKAPAAADGPDPMAALADKIRTLGDKGKVFE